MSLDPVSRVANTVSGLEPGSVSQQIGVTMLKKACDIEKSTVEQLMTSLDPAKGQAVNVYV